MCNTLNRMHLYKRKLPLNNQGYPSAPEHASSTTSPEVMHRPEADYLEFIFIYSHSNCCLFHLPMLPESRQIVTIR